MTILAMLAWLLSGWPVVWDSPRIPPRVQEVQAAFTARGTQVARGSSLSGSYDFTVNKPANTVDGDIMFMFLSTYIATPAAVDSVPNGWTLIATNTTGSSSSYYSRWYLYYRVASGEGNSYTWSLNKSCRYMATIISYASGDFDVQSISDITAISNTLYGTGNTTVRAASMNVPNANSPLVFFGSIYSTSVRTFTKPSVPTTDWVEDYDYGHTTPDLSQTIDSMIWSGSGDTGSMDAICSTSITTNKHAFAIALKPPSVSVPTISLSVATNKEATTATLNGEVTATGGENPTVTIYWGDNDGGQTPGNWDNNSAPTSPSQPQGAVTFYYDATGLASNTTIYFSAKATNSTGTDWPDSSLSFLTKPGTPTNLNFTNVTSTTLRLNWTAPSGGTTSYKVERCSGSGCSNFSEIASGGGNTYYDDSGLSGNTLYRYQVRATNASGDGPYSSIGETTTKYVSVTLTSDGAIAYGMVSSSKSTLDLSDTQTAKNDGTATENFTIKTSNATGGTPWTVGENPGTNIYVHEFSTNGGGAWTKFAAADSYQSLVSGVAPDGTQNIDFRVTIPSSVSDSQQKTITVTILAEEQ